jgi:hypothetical protein
MFSSFPIKGGLLEGRDARRVVRNLNRTAKRHRRKWHAHPDPDLMAGRETARRTYERLDRLVRLDREVRTAR